MGLDTRAFRRMSDDERATWVERTNAAGERSVLLGVQKLAQPVTLEDAPLYTQEGLDDLSWPGDLCGGLLSGNGNDPSFRGKVYDQYVETATGGMSLYAACHEPWEGEILAAVASDLRAAVDTDPAPEAETVEEAFRPSFDYVPSRDEREALARWFEVCVEHDLVVSGDY